MAELEASLRRVETVEDAAEFLRWLGERRTVLAIDTETTGLEWWRPNFLRLVQFGDTQTGWAISAQRWLGVSEIALQRYEGPTVFHNRNFDVHALEAGGLSIPKGAQHDTMIMDALTSPLLRHALKPMADRYLGPQASAGQGLLKAGFKQHGWDWASVPEDFVPYWAYAALDTVLTARIAEHLWPIVHANTLPAYEVEIAAQEVMYRVEKRGLLVDVGYSERKWQEWELEINSLALELQAYGVANPSSNMQVADALKEEEDWEPDEWTPTGQAMLDERVLRSLGGEIGPRVLRYRRIRKWRSTYIERFLQGRDADNRIHPSIGTMRARTGRMSITGPPLQTLPGKKSGAASEIRDCILPNRGDRLVAVDFDGQELRVLASYSGDPALIDAITNNPDPHRWVASMAYNKPSDEITKVEREIAKTTQYALLYGAGPAKIAATAGVSEAEVKRFLLGYFTALPGVKTFIDTIDMTARSRLATEGSAWARSWGGRRLEVEAAKTYKLLNALIQGSCADVLKHKIVALDSSGLGDLIALPVHDELLFSIPEADVAEVSPLIEDIMTERSFSVPLTVHASEGMMRWGDVGR